MIGMVVPGLANPFLGVVHMLHESFIVRALVAGTATALACGLAGYFLVLRRQTFTGDALSHVAFTAAIAALVLGIGVHLGLYAGCVIFALLIAALGNRIRGDDDAVIGSVFAWILGLGVLLVTMYKRSDKAVDGTAGVRVLFGSILGLSRSQVAATVGVTLIVVLVVVMISRPLLFASVDTAVAAASGVHVGSLGVVFLIVVALTAAAATQAVGALLLLGLLAAPAGAAQLMTSNPFRAMWLSGGIAVVAVWAGLMLSYANPRVPPSFGIVGSAAVIYLGAALGRRSMRHRHASGDASGPVRAGGI
jgi:zinc/manganese transport system permease protein